MKKYQSQLDAHGTEFLQRKKYMLSLLDTLNERRQTILETSPSAINRLEKRGKYPARAKI